MPVLFLSIDCDYFLIYPQSIAGRRPNGGRAEPLAKLA
jgi:hypothetical protein